MEAGNRSHAEYPGRSLHFVAILLPLTKNWFAFHFCLVYNGIKIIHTNGKLFFV